MKYILNEKFILDERYILTEDDIDVNINDTNLNSNAGDVEFTDNDTNAPKLRTGNVTNWEKRYQEAVNKNTTDSFWGIYFNQVWGNDAEKARTLGEAFIIELTEIGFNENENKFIPYVKWLFKNKIYPSSNVYGTIHNFLAGLSSDTARQDKYLSDQNWILYKPDLYKYPHDTVDDYIRLWNNIYSYRNKECDDAYINSLVADAASDGKIKDDKITEVLNALFFDNKKLKPITTIKQQVNKCFKEGFKANDKEFISAEAIKNFIENSNEGTPEDRTKAVILHLASNVNDNFHEQEIDNLDINNGKIATKLWGAFKKFMTKNKLKLHTEKTENEKLILALKKALSGNNTEEAK